MEYTSYLTDLVCSECGKLFNPDQQQTFCAECNAPLLADYNLPLLKGSMDRDQISSRPKGMWRWHELLPVKVPTHIISLGEGDTPLLKLPRLGQTLDLDNLFLKEEGLNPDGRNQSQRLCMCGLKSL